MTAVGASSGHHVTCMHIPQHANTVAPLTLCCAALEPTVAQSGDTGYVLVQAELQLQLAEYTAADWEGYKVMQLKIQALVGCPVLST